MNSVFGVFFLTTTLTMLVTSTTVVNGAERRCAVSCDEFGQFKDKVDRIYDHLFGESDREENEEEKEEEEEKCQNDPYLFTFTPRIGTWGECREMCRSMGGDLIHKNFGAEGAQYHQKLRTMVRDATSAWVGLTDRTVEGQWRLLDGRLYDGRDRSGLASWLYPDNWGPQGEDCAEVRHYEGDLNDLPCDGYARLGLCEIPNVECLRSAPSSGMRIPPGYDHYGHRVSFSSGPFSLFSGDGE